ncbi:hypothetical protein G3N59_01030 [Paraburkholderia sp. Ac-20340]|uniref:hypothetical protein n=1 Tax=Paraburkholderia sp. Ac-20340 TaxID=2703888 RepID=UPI00197F2FB4|nr:hypothetical protein [Paraburkholderia sp. Ac-20340]MBN3851950.1 hypothetical protein [Paraburkholderia sp. Ac-20340]
MTKLGCSFEGPSFGANYPDGTCIDGYLWDLDSCDEPGGPLHSGGDVPCPHCNTREYVVDYLDKRPTGNSRQRRAAIRMVIERVKRRSGDWA